MIVSDKTALFIDGTNLHYTAKALGFDIDFKRLIEEFEKRGSILRSYYYTTISEGTESAIRPLVDWLDYNGFTVRAKPAKEFDDGDGRRKIKRNIGIELAVDALEIAKHLDQLVLFPAMRIFAHSWKLFRGAAHTLRSFSSVRTRPPMVADELRRQADAFLELDDLKAAIGRH